MNGKKNKQHTVTLPTRQQIIDYLDADQRPIKLAKIAEHFTLDNDASKRALGRRLAAMQRAGQLALNRKGGYGPVDKMNLLQGRVIGHPDGYGFVHIDQDSEDLYLPPKEMRCVLHGDRILARVAGTDRRGRKTGAIVEILERANQQLVGRYYNEMGIAFVVPDNKRIHQNIMIATTDQLTAKAGQYVVVRITSQPEKHRQPIGKVVEVLGDYQSAAMAAQIAVHTYQIPYTWPQTVMKEAAEFKPALDQKDQQCREDLTSLPLVTIDGEDAKDFDDAVYCERQGSNWRLLVAIADVAHYVDAGTAIDKEAARRGNSVYFPGQVIPMLPEVLSTDLCSLNPEVTRLSLVCELRINQSGQVKQSRFFLGVIRSHARLSYQEVTKTLIDKDRNLSKKYAPLIPHLSNMYTLYQLLHERRQTTGVLDFTSTETFFEFDKDGRACNIHPLERNDAHRLIEEFMLAANTAAAGFLQRHEVPALYRIHEEPELEKLKNLRNFLSSLGLSLGQGQKPTIKDYADLITKIKGREDAHLIEILLLRSMRLAMYSADNIGHFGLGFTRYTHFTSPIRRYPDLLVHRAIRHLLAKRNTTDFAYSKADLSALAEHCSLTDMRAEEAARYVVKSYKCEFMQDKIGEIFTGTISGVESFGLFVELDNIYVDGLVHITALPADYYHFDPLGYCLNGERSGRSYRLADRLKVKVISVNLEDKKINFELVN